MVLKPVTERLPLTDQCLHYDELHEVPENIRKSVNITSLTSPTRQPTTNPFLPPNFLLYTNNTLLRYWHQRYSIFQYYDYDIRMTNDAWFGVTPEPVAVRIATDLANRPSTRSKRTLIDLFAGAGGNTIAFALSKRWDRIIAIEMDAPTLACAQHNAEEVYGVPPGVITWVHADCFDFLEAAKRAWDSDEAADEILDPSLQINPEETTIFASPPWGGVNYSDYEVFDLNTMEPYGLDRLNKECRPMEHTLFLPRTSDLRQIAKLVPPHGEKIDVVQYCMEGASKAMVAFIPAGY